VLFDLVVIAIVSATTFVATSLDNLLILVGFQTSDSVPSRVIPFGYLAAMGAMIGVAVALAAAADEGLPFRVGYLGLAPITIGLYHGVMAFRTVDEERDEPSASEAVVSKGVVAGFASVFVTMLANSADSLLVFTALIADTEREADWAILATVLTMAATWVWIARWLTGHPRFKKPLEGFARFGLPILLVGLGLYILVNSPTDVLGAP